MLILLRGPKTNPVDQKLHFYTGKARNKFVHGLQKNLVDAISIHVLDPDVRVELGGCFFRQKWHAGHRGVL